MSTPEGDRRPLQPLTPEQLRRRRQRNIALALSLVALFVLFYLLTIFRMGGNVASRGF